MVILCSSNLANLNSSSKFPSALFTNPLTTNTSSVFAHIVLPAAPNSPLYFEGSKMIKLRDGGLSISLVPFCLLDNSYSYLTSFSAVAFFHYPLSPDDVFSIYTVILYGFMGIPYFTAIQDVRLVSLCIWDVGIDLWCPTKVI